MIKLKNRKPVPLGNAGIFAVLILLVGEEGREEILFEKRSLNIRQPGEVSLPGGRVEAGESYEEAALRETKEEIGIDPSKIEILGELDYLVASNRMIRSFVGRMEDFDQNRFRQNDEVESIFTVPVKYFLENPPKNYNTPMRIQLQDDFPYERIPSGKDYPFGEYVHSVPLYLDTDPLIWGFTARIVDGFIKRLEVESC